MRKHYNDNLRNIAILFLFPVHTFMIWNNFGLKYYIWQGENKLLSTLIVLINPWFMPLLFLLAGISAKHAMEKRTNKEFIIERMHKLLIPFIFGMIFLAPFPSLFARKFFDAYNGGLLEHWKYFFTHYTSLNGYDGAFTPGHLWFILFLWIISLISLVIFRFVPYQKLLKKTEKLPVWGILMLFVPIWLMYYLGNFGGFSLGKNLALFLVGYYILSNDTVMNTVEKNIKWLALLWIGGMLALAVLYYKFSYYGDLWINFIGWLSVLVLMGFGKKFLNKSTGFTKYFNHASYPVYILHQSILAALAYYVVRLCDVFCVQVCIILFGSFIFTVLAYEIIKRIRLRLICN